MLDMLRSRSALARLLAVLFALALVAAACGDDEDDDGGGDAAADDDTDEGTTDSTAAAPSGDPYRIGVVMPLSGPVAFIGTPMLATLQAQVDYVNEVEGGVNGRPIELIVEDDGGDAARATSALRGLNDEGVSAIVGVPLASAIASAAPAAEELQITLLTIGAVPSILREGPQYLFQMDATSGSDAEPMTRFATELLADDDDITIALAPHDSPSSVEWADTITSVWADELGVEVVANVTVPLAAADVTAQAQEIVSSEPDVVMVQGGDAGMPVLSARLRSLGFEGPIVAYHGAGADATLRTLNDPEVYSMREVRSLDDDPAEYPGLARYLEVIERSDIREALESSPTASLGTYLGLVLKGTLEACPDPCDKVQFNETISTLSVDTEGLTFGNIEFGEGDHQGITESVFYHLQDGEITPALDGQTFSGDVYTMIDPSS
jgi:branched-chain amino acid transport system substrate-binding protein